MRELSSTAVYLTLYSHYCKLKILRTMDKMTKKIKQHYNHNIFKIQLLKFSTCVLTLILHPRNLSSSVPISSFQFSLTANARAVRFSYLLSKRDRCKHPSHSFPASGGCSDLCLRLVFSSCSHQSHACDIPLHCQLLWLPFIYTTHNLTPTQRVLSLLTSILIPTLFSMVLSCVLA